VIFSVARGADAPASSTGTTLSIINGALVQLAGGAVSVQANADSEGNFSITLPQGERAISIIPSSIPQGYAIDSFTYGAADLLAGPIRIGPDDSAEIAIVVDALKVEPRTVSGRVTGLLNTSGVRVVLQGGILGGGVEVPVEPDGSFTFSGILPGSYTARLSMSGPLTGTSVTVGNNDVTNFTIDYPRRFAIGAHVLIEGDTQDPPYVPPILVEARSGAGVVATATPATGNPSPLVITVSDGDHRISVRNVPEGYALKSMRYGDVNLLEEPLTVDGPITWEIVVRLVKS
jgi:hypothetical protein